MAYKRTSALPVAEGGTGLTAVTSHDILIGAGTSAINLVAPNATINVPFVSKGASADPNYSLTTVIDTITTSNTGTTALNICADATNNTVNIATGAGVKATSLGSSNTSSSTNIYCGSGNMTLNGGNNIIELKAGTGYVNISTEDAATSIYIGNYLSATHPKYISIGTGISGSTAAIYGYSGSLVIAGVYGSSTVLCSNGNTCPLDIYGAGQGLNIDNDATNNVVKLGTGAAVKTVTVGSTHTSSTTTINYGTGGYFLASASGNVMTATSAGLINYPLQPAFLAYLSSSVANATGDSSYYTIAYDTEVYNQGSHLSSGVFTAPVTGKFLFNFGAQFYDITSSYVDALIALVTSNRTYICGRCNPSGIFVTGGYLGLQGSVIADMDASDTAYVQVNVGASTKVIGVTGSSSPIVTYFSGTLEC